MRALDDLALPRRRGSWGRLATLAGVAVLVFVVLRALPGDAITAKLGTESGVLTAEQRGGAGAATTASTSRSGSQFTSWIEQRADRQPRRLGRLRRRRSPS